MRASKSWNFDLEKPIKPMKMDSCGIFADHRSATMATGFSAEQTSGWLAAVWLAAFVLEISILGARLTVEDTN